MKIKYLLLSLVIITFTACNEDDDLETSASIEPVEVSSGNADFSRMVAMGATMTSGYTDGALFQAGQMNSYPNIMASVMAHAVENDGSVEFTQPYTNNNVGGLLVAGQPFGAARFYFDGAGPATVPGNVTTEATNVTPGPYSNMAAPGANALHMLAPGYGSMAGLMQGLANPYYVRMASSDGASIIGDVLAQAPTFVTILSGFSDALASATDGATTVGMGTQEEFQFAFGSTMGALGASVPYGIVSNIPDVTNNAFFNTVGHDIVPLDAATAAMLTGAFADYNGVIGITQAECIDALQLPNLVPGDCAEATSVPNPFYGFLSAEEAAMRTITWAAGANNAVLIDDETLTTIDLSALGGPVLPNLRQATADDKILLSTATVIGTLVNGDPTLINGVTVPLDDTRVLIPSEVTEIQDAITGYNATIAATVGQEWAMFDAYTFFEELNSVGVTSGDFHMTGDLVFGGFYSLDGIHPTARGNAALANAIMSAIDSHYGSNLSDAAVDIGDYPTNYPPNM